jgi:hypothetical protein
MTFGSIAQLGEHLPYKQGVTGSSPVAPTNNVLKHIIYVCGSDSVVECDLAKVEVAGSNPVFRSII